ncbi:hypothetical protein SLA2020_425620 [Shorea laevis]
MHVGIDVVELYILSFGGGDEENAEEECNDGGRVDLNDPWWDDKISDDDDVFDVEYRVNGAGPSGEGTSNSRIQTVRCVGDEDGDEDGGEDGDGDGDEDGDEDGEDGDGDGDEEYEEGDDDGITAEDTNNGISGPSTDNEFIRSFEDVELDEEHSELGRSDILVSPGISDEDGEDDVITSNPKPNLEFYEVDLANPTLGFR